MAEKRVIEYEAASELANDDWLLIDGVTEGTRKARPNVVTAELGAQVTNLASTVGGLTQVAMGHEQSFAPSYDEDTSYDVGDLVMQYHGLYRCTAATTGAWDAGKWARTEVSDQLAEAGKVDDVKVDGTSVVTNKVAEIEIPVKDVEVDGTSVVNASGVAEITLPDVPVQDVQVKTDSTYDSVVDASGNAKIDISGKADTSGYYEDFIAGTAENLMADNYTEDKVPYNFRQSFNGARLEDEIVGGTVAWNQTYNYTVDGESNGVRVLVQNGVVTLSGTSTGTGSGRPFAWTDYKFTPSHKIIILKDFNVPSGDYIFDQYNLSSSEDVTGRIVNVGSGGYIIPQIKINAIGNVYNVSNGHLSVIDLTQALGSTIADYLYTIDQANAGAGLAKLREWGFCTKSYYAYNAGTLMSVNASSHVTVGKNLFDKNNVLNGYLQSDGTFKASNSGEKTFYCKVPKGTITMGKPVGTSVLRGVLFDKLPSNNDSGYEVLQYESNAKQTFTTTKETYYVCYCYNNTGETNTWQSVLDSIQIEFGSTATAYEPYTKHTYPLDSDLTLRGIPKLDANNKLYYDGDIYESDGSVKRKYGIVDLGSLNWGTGSVSGGDKRFYATVSSVKPTGDASKIANIICKKYIAVSNSSQYSGTEGICIHQSDHDINIYDKNYLNFSASEFKSAMSGVYLVYELATPTSETADAFATPQIVNPKGTEEYVDYAESQGTRDVAIPVGHNSKYYADLKAKIEDIPDVPSTNGTYTLKATRSNSGVAYSWVSG